MKYMISNSYCNNARNTIVFVPDNWDDYGFKTTFNATYIDQNGKSRSLGTIKIGISGALANFENYFWTKESLSSDFTMLPSNAFSLWQSAEAYQNVKGLSNELDNNIFFDLNDVAYNLDLLKKYRRESIMQNSLLRSVNSFTVENQFHRITLGRAKLTPFSFSYEINKNDIETRLDFDVEPNSFPPSNIHVLIGGNGVGKSSLIRDMIASICDEENEQNRGRFLYNEIDSVITRESDHFANVICVGFSPFDDFSSVEKYSKSKFTYIGTRKEYDSESHGDGYGAINLLEDIENHFLDSMRGCLSNITKREDLSEVIQILENDPMFYDYQISQLIVASDKKIDYKDLKPFKEIFSQMSSGHKVVLSIIVRCIDKMVEKTILLLDEPENHLHPPLVSSLIRSISYVLMKRNGVAIVSTHSPIVLQETPKSCVWQLSRRGDSWSTSRPRFETFGENIGTLTNDVFKYEISSSGFHALLKQSVMELESYDEVLEKYNGQLGDEARGIVRILFNQKERGEL